MPTTEPTKACRVLFVDDDELVRRSLTTMLRRLGYVVTAVESASVALREVARDGSWDVLVTDYDMPEMKGTILAREVRKLAPTVWIVLCSGRLSEAGRSLDQFGINATVAKPVNVDILRRSIEARLDSDLP